MDSRLAAVQTESEKFAAQAGATPAKPSKQAKICPTCGDRFEGGASFCGKDGTALVLLN